MGGGGNGGNGGDGGECGGGDRLENTKEKDYKPEARWK